MIYIGIDPGKSGFVAAISSTGTRQSEPTPVIKAGKGSRKEYDVPGMFALLERFKGLDDVKALLEKQAPRQKDGKVQAFATGQGFGLWQMALIAAKIPHVIWTPQRWRKSTTSDIPGKDPKQRSLIAAKRLFPDLDLRRTEKCKNDDDNKAEAFLMAWVCKNKAWGVEDE